MIVYIKIIKNCKNTSIFQIIYRYFIQSKNILSYKLSKEINMSNHQQHPVFFWGWVGLSFPPWLPTPAPPVLFAGLPWTFDFISLESVVNAFYTLTASLAEVSKNLIPSESARLFPSSNLTCLLASKSDLFPTSILTTFSFPYLSTSASQFSISLNDWRSVMS